MMTISKNNREEIERELLALIINKCEVIDLLQIKPKYLGNKELGKMLSYCIESYKKYKAIDPVEIQKAHNDFNAMLFGELLLDVFYHDKAWQQQLNLSEESILKYYKEDIINDLNKKLSNNEMNYDAFIEKMKKIESYKLNNSNNGDMLTIKDVDMKKEEKVEYIKSNTFELDSSIKGFALGQLSVWSGGNASSKSTYLNQQAIEAIQQGYNVAIYSGELVAKRLLNWMIMQCAGKQNISYNKQKDYWFVNSFAKDKILKWLDNRLFIYDNNKGNKAKDIVRSIKECVKRNEIKVVILDNLMSMNLNGYGENKYDVQSLFIQELSALAKELNIHIHFVCHPRKATNFLRKNDISGSADLTNIADNVFIMHRVNNDFKNKTKEMYKWPDNHDIYKYSNIIEICKNRDFGVEDEFIGMYFEKESKRLLNQKEEQKKYAWEYLK